MYYTTSNVLYHSATTRKNREFINSLCIVKESKVFGRSTKAKDENIESTEVHCGGGKEQVEPNVEKKGTHLIY